MATRIPADVSENEASEGEPASGTSSDHEGCGRRKATASTLSGTLTASGLDVYSVKATMNNQRTPHLDLANANRHEEQSPAVLTPVASSPESGEHARGKRTGAKPTYEYTKTRPQVLTMTRPQRPAGIRTNVLAKRGSDASYRALLRTKESLSVFLEPLTPKYGTGYLLRLFPKFRGPTTYGSAAYTPEVKAVLRKGVKPSAAGTLQWVSAVHSARTSSPSDNVHAHFEVTKVDKRTYVIRPVKAGDEPLSNSPDDAE